MTFRGALALALLSLTACQPRPGSARVTVVLEGETRTQCIKASARTASGATLNASPASIPRTKDTLVLAVGETPDLAGEIFVTITRFATRDCTGTPLGSETKSTQLVRGGATALLEFRYTDPPVEDGGVDAGVADGGVDGGSDAGACDLSACTNTPGECETSVATGCASDGGCSFTRRAQGTSCGDAGVCSGAGACVANVCAVLATGSACDDGLACTPMSSCANGTCRGRCAAAPACLAAAAPITCDSSAPASCVLEPADEGANCTQVTGGRCRAGACVPWVALQPAPNFLRVNASTVVYPDAGLALASADGGRCDTTINTDGPAATVVRGECGSPPLFATVDDAGVAVLTMTGLDVGPNAWLHFVGARPVQLIVLGSASVQGVISVGSTLPGERPAGSNPASCSAAQDGTLAKAGGGGGGFGANGGSGGENGGAGGQALSGFPSSLRGGCAGANGFRTGSSVAGGFGGGALQLIVTGTLSFGPGGVISASGGGGAPGAANGEGGGGGGSGGLVVLEAGALNLDGAFITANGGGGGEGGDDGTTSDPGLPGPINSTMGAPAANNPGSNGGVGGLGGDDFTNAGRAGGAASSSRGGGGGGGSAGIVYVRGGTCTLGSGVLSGAEPLGISCNP